MRIVAGRHRGKRLATPEGAAIRPTSDRVREAIFNMLQHGAAARELEGTRVLDLFAGTGAMGIEALSRGAGFALFVDEGVEARGLIRRNLETTGETGRARLFRRDVTRLGTLPAMPPFDIAFLDPPYGRGLGEAALSSAISGGWLAPGATVVLEESAASELVMPEGVSLLDRRVYGDTQVLFLGALSQD